MNELTRHRGPDSRGIFADEGISLGHDRLAIIDLTEAANQPMSDESGRFKIIFNGEIYNFNDLQKGLENKYNFFSKSDTEVLLKLFQEYDTDCFKMLNGIFAVAIWDSLEKRLILARDPIGVKPLYYYYQNNKLIFSSEIKAILAHKVERQVDHDSMYLYFKLLYVPEPRTMFKNVSKFPAGHYGVLKNNTFSFEQFGKDLCHGEKYESQSEAVARLKELFHSSVKRQLISDRPLGIFLSGGIDSSAVLAEACGITRSRVNTFSVGFEVGDEQEKFNRDSLLAKRTAKYFNTDHFHLAISADDVKNVFESMVWHLDEPSSNATAAAIYLLSKETKKKVAVVLGGDGGDELFGGYPRYYFGSLLNSFGKFPAKIRELGAWLFYLLKEEKIADKLKLKSDSQIILSFLGQPDLTLASLLNKELLKRSSAEDVFKELLDSCQRHDFPNRFMFCDLKSWLKDESLVRSDKMTMAHGLEQRVPILDLEMVDFAFSLPGAWKLNNSKQGKSIWINAVKDIIPPYLLTEPKRGWFSPMAKWLRSGLKDLALEHLSQLDEKYFDKHAALQMFSDHVDKRKYNLPLIWAMIAWQAWYNQFIKL